MGESVEFQGIILRPVAIGMTKENMLRSAARVIPRFVSRRRAGISINWEALVAEVFANDHSECDDDIVVVLIACGVLVDESSAGYMVISRVGGQIRSLGLPGKRTVFVSRVDVLAYIAALHRLYSGGAEHSVFRKDANIAIPKRAI